MGDPIKRTEEMRYALMSYGDYPLKIFNSTGSPKTVHELKEELSVYIKPSKNFTDEFYTMMHLREYQTQKNKLIEKYFTMFEGDVTDLVNNKDWSPAKVAKEYTIAADCAKQDENIVSFRKKLFKYWNIPGRRKISIFHLLRPSGALRTTKREICAAIHVYDGKTFRDQMELFISASSAVLKAVGRISRLIFMFPC
jgi:hypothetical protein